MRIVLEKRKQKDLIMGAKNNQTWKELAEVLELNENYLVNWLNKEKGSISDVVYKRLCKISNKNFDEHIKERLDDNWGRSKGGIISSTTSKGSTIQIKIPPRNEDLSELIGAILGDGHISYIRNEKTGVYQINIAGHKELDKEYHLIYLSNLFRELFGVKTIDRVSKTNNARHLIASSKQLVDFFINDGLKAGNKIKNQITIPSWIKDNDIYLRACIRGLIDTDGCVHHMSKKDPKLIRISFKNYNKRLLEDTRYALLKLGFNPSKIIGNKQFFLSRQQEIYKYLKEVGFSNPKHRNRLDAIIKAS